MNFKYTKGIISLLTLFLFIPHITFASVCTAVFPDAVQSNAAGSTITFACGTKLISNPDTILSTTTVSGPGGVCATKTCSATVNCTASGTPVGTLNPGTFQISSSATNVTVPNGGNVTIGTGGDTDTDRNNVSVGNNANLNFSDHSSAGTNVYRMNTLTVNQNSIVNFQPGDYWINTLTVSGNGNHTFKVVGTTGTVRLFINSAPNITRQISWNTGSVATNPAKQLFIYSYGGFTLNNASSRIIGVLYAVGAVALTAGGNAAGDVQGAVAGTNVTLSGTLNGTTVQYDGTAVNAMDFGPNLCPASTTTQFGVSAPSTGTNCQNMTVTVTAQTSTGQTVTNYTGSITLDTQSGSGTWVSTTGGGTFNNLGNGQATYTFVAGDNGTTTFQLSYPSSGSSPIIIKAFQTSSPSISGVSGSISFVPASLLITDVSVPNPPSSPPPAFSTSQTAGTSFTLYLTAYTASGCGIVTSYSGSKTLRFYTTYVDPTSGTLNATVNGTAIASSSGATQTTQAITFTNGVATINMQYNDVGKLMLNVMDTASSDGPSGASGNFVVKPAAFAFNIPGNSATQTTAPVNAAVTACLADSVFKKAGESFTVNVQPQNALGNVTPNYGNESVNQGILLQSGSLLAPNPGRNGSNNDGAIGNGSSFSKIISGGPFAQPPYFTGSTFSFDEVGCINLTASVGTGSYLGAGNVSSSIVVGRFIPDHLSVSGNTPQFTTVCSSGTGSFTYLDQLFSYGTQPILSVTAQALANTTTQNYNGNFWKLTGTGFGNVYNKAYFPVNTDDTIPALVLDAPNPSPTFVDGGNGTGTFTFSSGTGMSIQRLSGTSSPAFTAEIQLNIPTITDSDGVTCTGSGCISGGFAFGTITSGNGISFSGTGGGKQFYHGRMIIMDAIGSELLSLVMPMQTQFYTTAGNYVTNTLDSCTVFTGGATNLTLSPSTGLATTASFPEGTTFSQGNLNITLSAPNTTGYVDIEANLATGGANLPWLQYNWPYSGTAGTNFTDNPRGRGNFGIFKGNDRIIFEKEIYQ